MTKSRFIKGLLACALSAIMLVQAAPVAAAEPTITFNGASYTREEFVRSYNIPGAVFMVNNVAVTAEQFFDMFVQAGLQTLNTAIPEANEDELLHEYRLNAEEIAAWIYAYEYNGGISEVELQLLQYTNIERARAGVPLLELCPILSMAARFKVEEMAELRYFAHNSPVYGSPQNISRELFGIEDFRSENLTRRLTRQRVAYDLVQSWLGSPGHRANMLNPNHRYLGVGIIENVLGMGVNYDGTPIPDRYASLGAQKFR
jgi:uncharacterized protein YkwD